jgi:hypothetical protein
MSVDLIARGLALQASPLAPTALGLAGIRPPAALHRLITSGYATPGQGAGTYIADALATSGLASAHPRFCKQSLDGRFWRLLPDEAGLVPVACGGAVGFTAEPGANDAAADERTAIQAAEDYRHAIGAAGLRFDARRYAARRTTLPPGVGYHATLEHILFQVRSTSIWRSVHPEGTVLYRRKANGAQCDAADVEWTEGYAFRGGGILIHGTTTDTGPENHSFTLDNILLDGGLRRSMGTTFEVLDKGLWQRNDAASYCGHLTITGKAGVIGFASELVYASGGTPGSRAKRFLAIGPDCVFGETGGSCLNANGITLRVERCLCYNAYIGIEGWTGEAGGYLKAIFRDTQKNSIQGGVYSPNPDHYYKPNAPTPGTLPIGQLDVVLIRAGSFDVGSWITGRITAIDVTPSIGNAAVFVEGAEMVDLDIVTIADQASLNAGVAFPGGASGWAKARNISVRLDCKRTAAAVAAGRYVNKGVYAFGSFGPNIVVRLGAVDGMGGPWQAAGTIYDNPILILGYEYNVNFAPAYYDIQANDGATIDLKQQGPAIGTLVSSAGSYAMNLPTGGVMAGHRIVIADYSPNFVGGGAVLRIPAGNFRAGKAVLLPPGYGHMELAFDGGLWTVIRPPPAYARTQAWDPPSLAAGASATTTVAMVGVLPGDEVAASFSADLQGLVLTAYVSAAGTVTAVLFNPTGGAVDLASGTLTVTVR